MIFPATSDYKESMNDTSWGRLATRLQPPYKLSLSFQGIVIRYNHARLVLPIARTVREVLYRTTSEFKCPCNLLTTPARPRCLHLYQVLFTYTPSRSPRCYTWPRDMCSDLSLGLVSRTAWAMSCLLRWVFGFGLVRVLLSAGCYRLRLG